MTEEDIIEEPAPAIEYSLDMDNMPPVKHFWTDRGQVMSCEFAGHPNHRHFKFNKGNIK